MKKYLDNSSKFNTNEILKGIFNEEWDYYSLRKMTFGEIKKLYR